MSLQILLEPSYGVLKQLKHTGLTVLATHLKYVNFSFRFTSGFPIGNGLQKLTRVLGNLLNIGKRNAPKKDNEASKYKSKKLQKFMCSLLLFYICVYVYMHIHKCIPKGTAYQTSFPRRYMVE